MPGFNKCIHTCGTYLDVPDCFMEVGGGEGGGGGVDCGGVHSQIRVTHVSDMLIISQQLLPGWGVRGA